MTSPTAQGSVTAWTPWTRLQLRDLCLRATGVRDPAISAPTSAVPAASDEEVSLMDGFLSEALLEIGDLLDRYTPLAEASVTASSDFTAVLVPSDFNSLVDGGVKVSGWDVKILTTEEWLASQRPASEGGGTRLTDVSGAPGAARLFGRIVPAAPAAASDAKRMALFLYPVQTAAWTAVFTYRALPAAYGAPTDTIRLNPRLFRLVRLFVAALGCEHRGDSKGAADRWALYQNARREADDLAPSDGQTSGLVQDFPIIGAMP